MRAETCESADKLDNESEQPRAKIKLVPVKLEDFVSAIMFNKQYRYSRDGVECSVHDLQNLADLLHDGEVSNRLLAAPLTKHENVGAERFRSRCKVNEQRKLRDSSTKRKGLDGCSDRGEFRKQSSSPDRTVRGSGDMNRNKTRNIWNENIDPVDDYAKCRLKSNPQVLYDEPYKVGRLREQRYAKYGACINNHENEKGTCVKEVNIERINTKPRKYHTKHWECAKRYSNHRCCTKPEAEYKASKPGCGCCNRLTRKKILTFLDRLCESLAKPNHQSCLRYTQRPEGRTFNCCDGDAPRQIICENCIITSCTVPVIDETGKMRLF